MGKDEKDLDSAIESDSADSSASSKGGASNPENTLKDSVDEILKVDTAPSEENSLEEPPSESVAKKGDEEPNGAEENTSLEEPTNAKTFDKTEPQIQDEKAPVVDSKVLEDNPIKTLNPPAKTTVEPAKPVKSERTVIMEPVVADDKTPQTPKLGKIVDSPIEILHSIGDIHGWAPGLISYLINNKLATIEIDGYPLQDKKGLLDVKSLSHIFPEPIHRLKMTGNPVKAGLAEQPGFDDTGLNSDGHGKIKARWIAAPNVALIQIGDVYDRADHSELAAEILRQLIIDAPGRVFVMVGNHEQFMLEKDYNNWYFNEARNAFTEKGSFPQPKTRNHFRFLPLWDGKTETERAEATFERYINSTWTLFLTQGAVMQKLGWIDNKLNLKPMLEKGWAGYNNSRKIMKQWESDSEQKKIPGALTALVIGDTLFHHAEPAAHRTDDGQGLEIPLPETMTTVKSKSNNIMFRMYATGAGSLKNSPDAPLLWSRGSSSGAASGNPAAESHLEGLASAWKGLRRIIHGHTPTVGSGEFDSVTSGKSTTVSYLGESLGRQSSKGRANRIRIYNIDEGMSPAYYGGDESIYSPQRMPTGLRLEKDEFSSLEAKWESNQYIKINPSHSIDIDSRNLWKWAAGEWRNSAKPNWETSGPIDTSQLINHGKWKGFISTDTNSGSSTRSLLNRNINATQIGKLMIENMLRDILNEKPSVDIQKPKATILERIVPVGPHIAKGQIKKAWNAIEVVMVLIKQNENGNYSLICLNSTDREIKIVIQGVKVPKPLKTHFRSFKSKTITRISISPCERLFISPSVSGVNNAVKEWINGKDATDSNADPVIAHFFKSKYSSKKVIVNEGRVVSLTPPIASRQTTNSRENSNKSNLRESVEKWWKKGSNPKESLDDQSSESRNRKSESKRGNPQRTSGGNSMSSQGPSSKTLNSQGHQSKESKPTLGNQQSPQSGNPRPKPKQGNSQRTSGGNSANHQEGPKFSTLQIRGKTDLKKIGVDDPDYDHLAIYMALKKQNNRERAGFLALVKVNQYNKIFFDYLISSDGQDVTVIRRNEGKPIKPEEESIIDKKKNFVLEKLIISIAKQLDEKE